MSSLLSRSVSAAEDDTFLRPPTTTKANSSDKEEGDGEMRGLTSGKPTVSNFCLLPFVYTPHFTRLIYFRIFFLKWFLSFTCRLDCRSKLQTLKQHKDDASREARYGADECGIVQHYRADGHRKCSRYIK